ncbi:MAG: amidohydrolase family protein [Candidatus Aminicenantes bacterium]|nr:amidohydrolase family protein [Candidatus Aminicenantes bacterium]
MRRKIWLVSLLVCVTVLLCLSFLQAGKKEKVVVLVGGTLIDGTGAQPVSNVTVLIKGERIEAVGSSGEVKVPEDAIKIDVSGKWILPGFIDCHIHLGYPFGTMEYFTDNDCLATIRALKIMNDYLKSGVTAVRDVGSPIEPLKALMAAAQQGYVDSIRLYPCGYLLTVTGGHGDGISGALAVDGPWEFRKAVREMFKAGFRHIKISPTFTLEEVQAAVDEAKTLGLPITAHGGGQSDTTPTTMTKVAVMGGVDCIEHLNEMDVEVLDLMAKKGVYNVPTMSVYRELYKAKMLPKELVEDRNWTIGMHETLFKQARERKILMGIGTDSVGPFMKKLPGIYFTEMKYFVELGVSPMDTIVCATKNGATILDREKDLGTVEAGKLADLQILEGNPLESFEALGKPELVLVGGKVHKFK